VGWQFRLAKMGLAKPKLFSRKIRENKASGIGVKRRCALAWGWGNYFTASARRTSCGWRWTGDGPDLDRLVEGGVDARRSLTASSFLRRHGGAKLFFGAAQADLTALFWSCLRWLLRIRVRLTSYWHRLVKYVLKS